MPAARERDMSGACPKPTRGRRRALASLALIAIASVGCGDPAPTREWTPADHGQPSATDAESDEGRAAPAEPGATSEEADARAARALWMAACASCHGREGRGDGAGVPPGARVPDFSAPTTLAGKSDAQ